MSFDTPRSVAKARVQQWFDEGRLVVPKDRWDRNPVDLVAFTEITWPTVTKRSKISQSAKRAIVQLNH